MNRFSVYQAKAALSRLLRQVEQGETITICRDGKPVADLVAHRSGRDPLVGDPALKGAVFTADPTAPLDEEDWPVRQR